MLLEMILHGLHFGKRNNYGDAGVKQNYVRTQTKLNKRLAPNYELGTLMY